uniref:redoxin domain-containing protein n=1 Tax=uncultured Tenacibaculum sp. TaxID=174713 RepID=UPI00342C7B88
MADQNPDNFTLVVFYRGLHCPLCKKYLQQLKKLLSEFEKRGVNVVAVSKYGYRKESKTFSSKVGIV